MTIQIENRQTRFKIRRREIRATLARMMKLLGCADMDISIVFTDDKNIREINKHYLGKDKATNVISFSLREGRYGNINPHILGDIVISVETAQRDAVKGNLSTEQEIDYLLIHGTLHLLGYNHENTSRKDALLMKRKEKELFHQINSTDKFIR